MTPAALTLRINGKTRTVLAALDDTLLTTLRDALQLTGAKRGCNQGVCGACTVLIDSRPARACLSLTHTCASRDITTIDGPYANIAQLQKAFAETGAVQCGFCTPGMILSAAALLAEKPQPSVEDIRTGLSGNLCRCSGYRKIIEAVQLAAEAGPQ
ncbi:MAG TPA: (2Fe-2S)-binding protein [Alphaproteobacteria bacterium]|nr:(2Fe-2S)-binding protein [Alphaproteobacteria bacterium]